MGKREREEVDGKSCKSDDNFWSDRSAADSENRHSIESNGEKSAGSLDERPAAQDDDGTSNRENGDGTSEGDFTGWRRSTSPTISLQRQHHRLQVRSSVHAGLGRQCLQEVQSPVDSNPSRVHSSPHCL